MKITIKHKGTTVICDESRNTSSQGTIYYEGNMKLVLTTITHIFKEINQAQ